MPQGDDSLFGYAWLLGETVAAFSTDSLTYCLIGAVALGAYGRPRATQDLDLLILADRMGCDAYRNSLLGKGFEVSSKWQEANPMARDVVMRLHHPSVQDFPLDLIFATSDLHRSTLRRRQSQSLSEKEVWVSSPEDLLLLKLVASRPRDFEDAVTIVANLNVQLDFDYLWSWAERLGLQSELHYVLISADPK